MRIRGSDNDSPGIYDCDGGDNRSADNGCAGDDKFADNRSPGDDHKSDDNHSAGDNDSFIDDRARG